MEKSSYICRTLRFSHRKQRLSSMKTIISHLYKDHTTGRWVIQSNDEHTQGVARLAEGFAARFGMPSWGRVLGLLHDKGKESDAFQQHIRHDSGYDTEARVVGNPHHAFVGAELARRAYGPSARDFIVNPILSHHSGLHDYDEVEQSILQEIEACRSGKWPAEVDEDIGNVALERPPFRPETKDYHHLARMLYSCLVDADYLDTEAFMAPETAALRANGKRTLSQLLPLLEERLAEFKAKGEATEVNRIRSEVQAQCAAKADGPMGFYSLTVPTGGGKTLSSLLWAMKHAVHNGQDRVIIAIPFTSIIVQTAAVLRSIFGEENVLEHHSNFTPETIADERQRERMKLATENWDYPIMVTTNVQLFESMFAARPSACRKLHNVVRSVVVLDEVQTLPIPFLQPIVDALAAYRRMFGVSVLFTTASQPVLSGLIEGCNPRASFKGLAEVEEIIPASLRLHERLRRVELTIDNGARTYDEVARMLTRHERVLCIVNTRRDARELFERLPREGITLHLSRNMCPAHIAATIRRLKEALADERQPVVRVVATQLIEAGVDIDFPVVYRQEAGLDSILQAAGRCNREGRLPLCTTHVFSLRAEHPLHGTVNAANEARMALGEAKDWFAPATMTSFFSQLYCRCESFDKNGIRALLYSPQGISFAQGAKAFRLIDDAGSPIVVDYADSMELVQQLREEGPSYGLMKKLGQYTVSVKQHELKALLELGVLSEEAGGIRVLRYAQQYDTLVGLRTENTWEGEVLVQ